MVDKRSTIVEHSINVVKQHKAWEIGPKFKHAYTNVSRTKERYIFIRTKLDPFIIRVARYLIIVIQAISKYVQIYETSCNPEYDHKTFRPFQYCSLYLNTLCSINNRFCKVNTFFTEAFIYCIAVSSFFIYYSMIYK